MKLFILSKDSILMRLRIFHALCAAIHLQRLSLFETLHYPWIPS